MDDPVRRRLRTARPRGLTSPPTPVVVELTVVTFNTHAGLRPRRGRTCEPYDLAAVLRTMEADVVVLQESFTPDGGRPVVAVHQQHVRPDLVATDLDWSYGRGPEVHGTGEALLMAMAGRSDALRDLTGPGGPKLAARL